MAEILADDAAGRVWRLPLASWHCQRITDAEGIELVLKLHQLEDKYGPLSNLRKTGGESRPIDGLAHLVKASREADDD